MWEAARKRIGQRAGYLTAVEVVGKKIRFRCDCGNEVVRRASDVFRERGLKSCGKGDCPYHRKALCSGSDYRKRGFAFETGCAEFMREQGWSVELTNGSWDFGVDFLVNIDDERVAFQCKQLGPAAGVAAVQEVYAGGRYYDCRRFVVMSPSGFTQPAEQMASKLGVQLETDLADFRLKEVSENVIATNRLQAFNKKGVVWEIDGVSKLASEWCAEHGVSKNAVIYRVKQGMDLKTALTKPKYTRAMPTK